MDNFDVIRPACMGGYNFMHQGGAWFLILKQYRAMNDVTIKKRVNKALKELNINATIVTHYSGPKTLFAPDFDKLYNALYVELMIVDA